MKTIKLLLVMIFCFVAAACGGGGDSGGTGSATGTAAQYFTKNAVGNTWAWLETNTQQATGQPTTTTRTRTKINTVYAAGAVTSSNRSVSNGVTSPGYLLTTKIDTTGAMVSTDGTINYLDLPATFSVGTTWDSEPAIGTQSAAKVTVAAFNVTRTVPAGIFTDCLQLNVAYSDTTAGVTTTTNATVYVSPTAGGQVDTTRISTSTNAGVTTTTTSVEQLQAGYIANSVIPTSITATANTTAQNLTAGTAISSFTPLTASGGTMPYTYSYTGTLPVGLSFNTSTGAITGTPTAAYATANLIFSVKDANNVTASTTSTVSFSVSGSSALPAGYVAQGGLTWMPITFQDNWPNANAYCANTVINGQTGWRLPTKAELIALYASGTSGAIIQGSTYLLPTWSSTIGSVSSYYSVYLVAGSLGGLPIVTADGIPLYVTCVR